jgi:hypothetical protein
VVIDPTGTLSRFGHVLSVAGAIKALGQYGPAEPFALVVQPEWGEKLEDKKKGVSLWKAIFDAQHVLVLVDETHRYADANRIDDGLANLVATGRHHWIDLVTTVQTPPQLHSLFRGNADVVVSFAQPYQPYADTLAGQFFGGDASAAAALAALPAYAYLRRDTKTNTTTHGRVSPCA